jgi:hypothetical protein
VAFSGNFEKTAAWGKYTPSEAGMVESARRRWNSKAIASGIRSSAKKRKEELNPIEASLRYVFSAPKKAR